MDLRVLTACLLLAVPAADEHLLAGAGAFQKESFDVALVEFTVAAQLGAPEAGWYVAASLQKLGRPEESIEAFQRASRSSPSSEDELLDFYYALACYDARLYHAADGLLRRAGERSGPKIALEARRTRDQIAHLTDRTPPTAAIDWYIGRGQRLSSEQRASLAALFFQEAAWLAQHRPDSYRLTEAQGLLTPGRPGTGKTAADENGHRK